MTDKDASEKPILCLDCKKYYNSEFMEKYPCSCCGSRACLAKHAKNNNITCEVCNISGLCRDCCVFALCCGDRINTYV